MELWERFQEVADASGLSSDEGDVRNTAVVPENAFKKPDVALVAGFTLT